MLWSVAASRLLQQHWRRSGSDSDSGRGDTAASGPDQGSFALQGHVLTDHKPTRELQRADKGSDKTAAAGVAAVGAAGVAVGGGGEHCWAGRYGCRCREGNW